MKTGILIYYTPKKCAAMLSKSITLISSDKCWDHDIKHPPSKSLNFGKFIMKTGCYDK